MDSVKEIKSKIETELNKEIPNWENLLKMTLANLDCSTGTLQFIDTN